MNDCFVIFDLDGTLIDSFDTIVLHTKAALCNLGCCPDKFNMDVYRGRNLDELFADVAQFSQTTVCQFKNIYDRCYMGDPLTGTRVIEETCLLLQELKSQGNKIVILTNKRQELAEVICNAMFGKNAVDYIIGRKDEFNIKHKSMLFSIFKSLDIPLSSCITYFGDSDTDRTCAELLGIPFVNTIMLNKKSNM